MPIIRLCSLLIFLLTSGLKAYAQSDADTSFIIKTIRLEGNKKTKAGIIFRELTFNYGDTLHLHDKVKRFERSRQNLMNTTLFNFVTITDSLIGPKEIEVKIKVIERWYIFPSPIFELADRNFNAWWERKDFSRANYGFYIAKDNFRGRREKLRFVLRLGYTMQYGFSYDIPFIDKKKRSGITVSTAYSKNHEIAYATINNRLRFFRDHDLYMRKEFSAYIRYNYRKSLYNTHSAIFKYAFAEARDTIVQMNPEYFLNNNTRIQFLSLGYIFRREKRNSVAYPLTGYCYDLELSQNGLGILPAETFKVFKSETYFRKYIKLAPKWYYSGGIRLKYSSATQQPYIVYRALGYGDYVRGYEYYVIDGDRYGLLKQGIKYEIVKPTKAELPYIKNEKFKYFFYAFYAEVFSDIAYVRNRQTAAVNSFANQYIYGNGIGIHYVTYYDKVLRVEFSMNRLREKGIFLHFSTPI